MTDSETKISINVPLRQHLANYQTNFDSIIESCPDLYLAAEQVHDIFDQLFTEQITAKNPCLSERLIVDMIFGAYLAGQTLV